MRGLNNAVYTVVLHRVGVDAETHRGGALRIEVDDQHAPAVLA